jgi:tape measure domain-containing protein
VATDIEVRLALNAIGFSKGTAQAKSSLRDLGGELTRLKSIAAGALSFAGIGVGVNELVRVADQYGQITARLRLATRATGDFDAVQQQLRQSAEETRAPLQETVNLYTQIAPSLQAIGRSSEQAVGLITTVNQAIALSGASSQQASDGLRQFTQAFSGGILRAEELNSVLEQTPSLADAIARGLGVTRGELRGLVLDGKVTADVLADALERVAASVAEDFAALPVTVGQSITLLQNSFLLFVGALDEGTGATSAISNGIVSVSRGIDALSGSMEIIRPIVSALIAAVDLLVRPVKALGVAAGGTAAVLERLFSGDIKGAADTYRQLFADVASIAGAPLAGGQQKQAEALAVKRTDIELDLSKKLADLEKLRAVAVGTASADILKSETQLATQRNKIASDGLKDRLKGEEALAKALAKSFEDSLEGARKARDEASVLRTGGRDARTSLQDKASERRNRGLSDSERSDIAERNAGSLTAQATLEAGRASAAVRDGDLKRAESLAASAVKLAERAERAADAIADDDTAARALEDLGKVQERIAEAQAQGKDREATDLEAQAKTQNELLAQSQAWLVAIRAEIEKPVTLQADIAQAEAKIATLQAQLAAIQDKTVTVTVNTVAQGAAAAAVAPAAPALPGLATGGWTGPGSKFKPAGIVHANEFVLRSEITRQPGVLQFMQALNRDGLRALRGYASGGLVGNVAASVRTPQIGAANDARPAVFRFPGIGDVPARIDSAVADALDKRLRREALKAGRR